MHISTGPPSAHYLIAFNNSREDVHFRIPVQSDRAKLDPVFDPTAFQIIAVRAETMFVVFI